MLNWTAYAIAQQTDPRFRWVDVREPGQEPKPTDVLSRQVVPSDRLSTRATSELIPNEAEARIEVTSVIRSDEPPRNVKRLLEFLRLPAATQQMLESTPPSEEPHVVVLSNGHRVVAHYPSAEAVEPTIRAICESGITFLMTFADDPPRGRFAFDNVIRVDGRFSEGWRGATLTVEKWSRGEALRPGSVVRLGELRPLASVLSAELG